jgi:REP element-mobilizing transposase RayT
MSIAERCAYGRCMPRLPRRQIPDGLYHVTTRGNRRQPIVLEDRDCEVFLVLLGKVVKRLGWKVHAYCLMTNHYHLLVETPNADISVGMQLLNGQYAQAFNRRHGYEGHLFERRFAAAGDRERLAPPRSVSLHRAKPGTSRTVPSSWRMALEQLPRDGWARAMPPAPHFAPTRNVREQPRQGTRRVRRIRDARLGQASVTGE